MSAPQRAQDDEPIPATVAALLIGVVIVVLFLASMHAAGTGRGLW